jgi:hypothetical protein
LLPEQDEHCDQKQAVRQRRQRERNRTTGPPYFGSLEHGSPRRKRRLSENARATRPI